MKKSVCSMKQFMTVVVVVFSLSLSGCLKEKVTHWLNKETYSFNGVYSNQHNDDLLVFKDAKVSIQTAEQTLVVPFSVKDTFVHIQVRKNTREKRPDIVMRIHGNGEALTCSACAKYHLSNIWIREALSLNEMKQIDSLTPVQY